jgi:transcriptional regulator with XRE-family HTH domain
MAANWAAVAEAINTRLEELDMTQQELAVKSGVSTATLRELQHNRNPRKRSTRLLEAVSKALRWPAGHLGDVLDGGAEEPWAGSSDLHRAVDQLRADVDALTARLEALERKS